MRTDNKPYKFKIGDKVRNIRNTIRAVVHMNIEESEDVYIWQLTYPTAPHLNDTPERIICYPKSLLEHLTPLEEIL